MHRERKERSSEIIIEDGKTRREYRIPLSHVGRLYGNGASREWVRRVERAEELSSEVRRRYIRALRCAIAQVRRFERIDSKLAAEFFHDPTRKGRKQTLKPRGRGELPAEHVFSELVLRILGIAKETPDAGTPGQRELS